MTTVTIYVMKTESGELYASLHDESLSSSETVAASFPVVLENGRSCLGTESPNEDAWEAFRGLEVLFDECHFQDLLIEFANAAFQAGMRHGMRQPREPFM